MKTVFEFKGNFSLETDTLVKMNNRYFKTTSIDSDTELSMEYVGFFRNCWLKLVSYIANSPGIYRVMRFINTFLLPKVMLPGCAIGTAFSIWVIAIVVIHGQKIEAVLGGIVIYLLNVSCLAYGLHEGGKGWEKTERLFGKNILGKMCDAYGHKKIKSEYSDEAYEAFKKTHSDM